MPIRRFLNPCVAGARGASVVIAAAICMASLAPAAQRTEPAPLPSKPTAAQKSAWIRAHSNWGRWGKDDERGVLNLIDDRKRQQAMKLARTGVVVPMARNAWVVNRNPANPVSRPGSFFEMNLYQGSEVDPGSTDVYIFDMQHFAVHGGFVTHVDSLCHLSFEGQIYNGYSYKDTVTPAGCAKAGMQHLKGGLVTRGLLIDMPALRGVSTLQPSDRLTLADIALWEKRTGLRIGAGDALILYTGQRDVQPAGQTPIPQAGALPDFPKFDTSLVPFFKSRDVAVLGLDNVVADAQFIIIALGMYAINNMDLNELAATARRLNRWEFMLTVAPLTPQGATGAAVNPLAMF